MSNTSKKQSLEPTVPTNNTVVPLPPEAAQRLLTDVFFAPLRVILETAGITRQCHSLDDLIFALLGVLRALQASANGRDFLQTQAFPQVPELTRGNYFAARSSPRQLALLQALARHRRTNQRPNRRAKTTSSPSCPNSTVGKSGRPTVIRSPTLHKTAEG